MRAFLDRVLFRFAAGVERVRGLVLLVMLCGWLLYSNPVREWIGGRAEWLAWLKAEHWQGLGIGILVVGYGLLLLAESAERRREEMERLARRKALRAVRAFLALDDISPAAADQIRDILDERWPDNLLAQETVDVLGRYGKGAVDEPAMRMRLAETLHTLSLSSR